jgi:hypothetical protein
MLYQMEYPLPMIKAKISIKAMACRLVSFITDESSLVYQQFR